MSPSREEDGPVALGAQIIVQLVVISGVSWMLQPETPPRAPPQPPTWAMLHDDAPVRPYGPAPRDPGGRISDYVLRVFAADRRGARVEIRGVCISACTLLLGARDVCIHRDAMLWFHAASNRETRRIDAAATRKMALY